MIALAEPEVCNDLAQLIAAAENMWTQVVLQELETEELLEANWEHQVELVAA